MQELSNTKKLVVCMTGLPARGKVLLLDDLTI